MLAILAAAVLALPAANQQTAASVQRNLPPTVVRARPLTIWFDALADERGKIRECDVRAVHGDASAGEQLCREFVGKRLVPGHGPNGEPIAGMLRREISVTDSPRRAPSALEVLPPDLEVQVNRLPDDARDLIVLAILVDELGASGECEGGSEQPTALVRLACEQASQITFPVRKIDGREIPYVRPFTVKFAGANGDELD